MEKTIRQSILVSLCIALVFCMCMFGLAGHTYAASDAKAKIVINSANSEEADAAIEYAGQLGTDFPVIVVGQSGSVLWRNGHPDADRVGSTYGAASDPGIHVVTADIELKEYAPFFHDVSAADYFKTPVTWAYLNGITAGTGEDMFSPNALCIHAQILTFLYRCADSPEPLTGESPYETVVETDYFYNAVLWAYAQGILTDAAFDPNAPCTRAEALLYIWRFEGSPAFAADAGFADVDADAEYAQAVAWGVQAGITYGVGEDLFDPDAVCTRAQIVSFLHRYAGEPVPKYTAVEMAFGEMDAAQTAAVAGKLPKLHEPTRVLLGDMNGNVQLSLDEIMSLRARFPHLNLTYIGNIAGREYDFTSTKVDLSGLSMEVIDAVLPQLNRMPALKEIELMDAEGKSCLSMTEVKTLMNALPGKTLHYSFVLFGKTLSTTDTRVEYDSVKIGNDGAPLIRQALDIMPKCSYLLLDSCGIDNEVMASIRDSYPNTKVVWRIFIQDANVLTDENVLRITSRLNNNNCEPLKYCTEAVYLDIGHNSKLTDISFIQYMPNLECVIVSGASVTDISVFKYCNKLIWLELCFCGYLSDISVLENHPTLKYLNISESSVSDISALENVALERFNCMNTKVKSWEVQQHFIDTHPDCITLFKGTQPYGYGWRYDDYGYTFFWYYKQMREYFRYGDTSYFGNHKGAAPNYLP